MGGDGLDPETGEISIKAVEAACEQLLASMPLQSCKSFPHFTSFPPPRPLRTNKNRHPRHPRRRKGVLHRPQRRPQTRAPRQIQAEEERIRPRRPPARHGHVLPLCRPAPRQGRRRRQGGDRGRPGHRDLGAAVPHGCRQGGRPNGGREVRAVRSYPTDGGAGANTDCSTFLGGLAVALARGEGVEEACAWGSVAASFAIEQVGVPVLGADKEGRETWNCVRVDDRLAEFKGRTRKG